MEIDRSYDEDGVPLRETNRMELREADATGVRIAKEVFRWSSAVARAAVLAVDVLEPGHLAQEASISGRRSA